MTITEEEDNRQVTSHSKLWIDYEGGRHCTESFMTMADGTGASFVTIQSGGIVYVLNVADKTAREIPAADDPSLPFPPGSMPEYRRYGGVLVGRDTVAGYETDIYEYLKLEDPVDGSVPGESPGRAQGGDSGQLDDIMSRAARQSNVRTWIWRGIDFPLKTIIDDGTRRLITETVRIAVDVNIPERIFTVPEGYTVKRMPR